MSIRRFADLYLWSQAIKVLSFISWAFFLIALERATRLLLTVVSWFVPAFVAEWATRKWQGAVLPALPGLLKRPAASFRLSARRRAALNEERAELYYDAPDLIRRRGYPFEQHYVETSDGFLLGLHRIPHGRAELEEAAPARPRPVVFLMHGFLQSSEAFVAARSNLPFQLADAGFDVWLGNARGNKYSAHHRHLRPDQDAYWNFCIDDVAGLDVPASLQYVTQTAGVASLAYIGFSMGTAVAFAAFSTRFDTARLVHAFIALAPATTARGFSQPLLDSIAKMSPDFVYFLLGRHALFGSIFYFWQNLLSNAQLVRLIDWFVLHMFAWRMEKVSPADKPVLYSHIYSMSSVKSVVHWFQIMKDQRFQRYVDWAGGQPVVFAHQPTQAEAASEAAGGYEGGYGGGGEGKAGKACLAWGAVPYPSPSPSPSPSYSPAASPSLSPSPSPSPCPSPSPLPSPSPRSSPVHHRHSDNAPLSSVYRSRVAQIYPLHQIRCPVHVLWGSADHLPDTEWLLANLPPQATSEEYPEFEHLDFLYAEEAKRTVFPNLVRRCKEAAQRAEEQQAQIKSAEGAPGHLCSHCGSRGT